MNEFTLGTFVGVVQTVIGHPLDTIKTNYQNNKILRFNKNSITTLYRGLSYPLFSTYHKWIFCSIQMIPLIILVITIFISGFMTGIVVHQ